jgi:hypothetical protein
MMTMPAARRLTDKDRERFHVTKNGIVLVTPEMLGQHLYVVDKEQLTA